MEKRFLMKNDLPSEILIQLSSLISTVQPKIGRSFCGFIIMASMSGLEVEGIVQL